MEEAKERVEEAKKEKTSNDFDPDLFDFDDGFGTEILSKQGNSVSDNNKNNKGDGKITASSASNSKKQRQEKIEYNKNNENKDGEDTNYDKIKFIGKKLQEKFGSMISDKKPIEEILEYVNPDDLVKDLRKFHSNGCDKGQRIQEKYNNELNEIDKKYFYNINKLNNDYSKRISDLRKTKENEFNEAKLLKSDFDKGLISQIKANLLYTNKINNAKESYNKMIDKLNKDYNLDIIKADDWRNERQQEINNEKVNEKNKIGINKCSDLFHQKNQFIDKIENKDSDVNNKINKIIGEIVKSCTPHPPCKQIVKIYQDIRFVVNPNVRGFSNYQLGDRVSVRNTIDGIKTPIHEYLHYLSNGEDGTSGVKNMQKINKMKAEGKSQTEINNYLLMMRGFNEGITELLAQHYTLWGRDEYAKEKHGRGVGIPKGKGEVKSYNPQVKVIEKIRKIIGRKRFYNIVEEAYFNHDLSIIEEAVTKEQKRSHEHEIEVNWEEIENKMAELQYIYDNCTDDTDKARMQDLSDEIIEMLDGKAV